MEWRYSPTILGLDTKWGWEIRFMPRGLYPRHPLDRRLGGSKRLSGRCAIAKNICPTGNQTPAVYPVARCYTDLRRYGKESSRTWFPSNICKKRVRKSYRPVWPLRSPVLLFHACACAERFSKTCHKETEVPKFKKKVQYRKLELFSKNGGASERIALRLNFQSSKCREFCSFSRCPGRHWDPPNILYNGYRGLLP
jgi:hypothetical protein